MSDEWQFYKRWLTAGAVPTDIPLKDGDCHAFYGHDHEFKRAAIFRANGGKWHATLNGKPTDPARLFESLLRPKKLGTPVAWKDYVDNRDIGTPFPKQRELQEKEAERERLIAESEKPAPQEIGANLGPPSDMERLHEIGRELERIVRTEDIRLTTHQDEKASEETYLFFSKVAQKAHDLKTEADQIRLASTKPLRDQVAAINAAWAPAIETADRVKGAAKDRTMPYHDRIERERADFERRAAANRDAMSTDERLARRASGGTSTYTKQNVEIVDIKALGLYFLSMKEPPNALVAVLSGLAAFAVKTGIDIPGIKVTETKEVRT